MLRNGRVLASGFATLIVAGLMAGCASHPDSTTAGRSAADAAGKGADASPATPASPVILTGATLLTDGGVPRLLLSGSGALAPTVYTRDGGTRIVVDLADTTASPGFEPPRPDKSLLSRVEMRSFTELGRPHVQLEMTARVPVDSELGTEPGSSSMSISFRRKGDEPAIAAVSAPREPAPEPIRVETIPAPAAKSAAPTRSEPSVASASTKPAAASAEPVVLGRSKAAGKAATQLSSISTGSENGTVTVRLAGNGGFTYETFALQNPPRFVVDLAGVRNAAARKLPETKGGAVAKIRVSQFKTDPSPVTRVVLDLTGDAMPVVTTTSNGLSIAFGGAGMPSRQPVAATTAATAGSPATTAAAAIPAAGSYERHETEDPSEKVVKNESAPAKSVAAPAPVETTPASVAEKREAPVSAPEVMAAAPATSIASSSGAQASAPAPSETASAHAGTPAQAESATQPDPSAAVEVAPQVVAASPEVRVAPAAEAARAPRRKKVTSSEDRALVEAAEALLNQQDAAGRAKDLVNPFESRSIGTGEQQYTGEPITLNLKDADIKDTLQKFSELTGLNIVLDPEVRGTVTVSLTDIPWDQALQLILKINGLGYVLEGNIMRIAATPKLAREEGDRQALAKAQDQNRPVKTVIRKLSYAGAAETSQIAKKVMSARGDIFVDDRSNTLIIKELPDYLPTVLDLINNLDAPTPQVMIEARVVEATRSFSKNLGVDWGFNAVADAAHGNPTGLVFPSSTNVSGNVSLPSGTQLLSASFANVLNTFNLDLKLSAAESRGLLRVVSTPKIQTQTNQQASIQSGFQIPVQTTVNNTTSVLYVDATLRLDVTPQITAEGTVILDIKVQKREPAVSLNIAGGQNIPLVTRDAKTKLMVRDGGTAVIGGIFKLSTNDQQSMVPSLWKIPILGYLFRNRTGQETADELMIFITPRIMKN